MIHGNNDKNKNNNNPSTSNDTSIRIDEFIDILQKLEICYAFVVIFAMILALINHN